LFHKSIRNFTDAGGDLGTTKILMAVLLAVLVAGCGGLSDRTWVAQAPGDSPEVQRAQREAAAAKRAPAARAAAPAGPAWAAASGPASAAPAGPVAGSAPGAYTQATRYGDLLFVSGQIAMDLATSDMRGTTMAEQTRQVMENIRSVLESHRLTMANVVSTTVYIKSLNEFREMDEVYETYFRTALPARSVVEVSRLPRNALVEISVIAGR
jgi:2-iminobutanoate/2-iminopropanoate deaminase